MVAPIRIRFIGCGDAFGSGGRLQTCLCVESDTHRFLIDCGASALVGLRKFGVDPNAIDTVLVTHMHGDHYAGIPWLALQRAAAGVRRPLGVLGPEGTAGRLPGRPPLPERVPAPGPLQPRNSRIRILPPHDPAHTPGPAG